MILFSEDYLSYHPMKENSPYALPIYNVVTWRAFRSRDILRAQDLLDGRLANGFNGDLHVKIFCT
jgi:hypothetical protein